MSRVGSSPWKFVETEFGMCAATAVGGAAADPFRDASSAALNPGIRFTRLFGLMAAGSMCC